MWASEVEPYPIAVTRSRFPTMKHLGDISKINGAEIEPVDIITFGSPCQDLSVAGKRAGLEGARSGLFMEAVRIIKEMREATNGQYPRFALWENVPGAFSSNKGEDFRVVLEELIKIAEPGANMPEVPPFGWAYADSYIGDGWSLAYRVFDTQYWPRTPQRRRRIYLVADFRGQCAREVLFEREGLRGYLTESPPPRERVTAYVEVGSGTANCERTCHGFPLGFRPENVRCYKETATTLCNGTRAGFCNGVIIGFDAYNQAVTAAAGMSGNNQPWICKPTYALDQQGGKGSAHYAEEVMPTLCSDSHGTPHAVAYWDGGQICGTLTANNAGGNQRMPDKENFNCVIETVTDDKCSVGTGTFQNTGVGWWNESGGGATVRTPCGGDSTLANVCVERQKVVAGVDCRNMNEYPDLYPTLQAKPNGGQSLNFSGAVRDRYIVRRLTPTECARLQGFPDTWGHPNKKDSFSDEEYEFWREVRNTHASINGKAVKEYTKDQMLKWYNKLHSDSAEYKMWGNGIALPPALYCMQGIADVLKREH